MRQMNEATNMAIQRVNHARNQVVGFMGEGLTGGGRLGNPNRALGRTRGDEVEGFAKMAMASNMVGTGLNMVAEMSSGDSMKGVNVAITGALDAAVAGGEANKNMMAALVKDDIAYLTGFHKTLGRHSEVAQMLTATQASLCGDLDIYGEDANIGFYESGANLYVQRATQFIQAFSKSAGAMASAGAKLDKNLGNVIGAVSTIPALTELDYIIARRNGQTVDDRTGFDIFKSGDDIRKFEATMTSLFMNDNTALDNFKPSDNDIQVYLRTDNMASELGIFSPDNIDKYSRKSMTDMIEERLKQSNEAFKKRQEEENEERRRRKREEQGQK